MRLLHSGDWHVGKAIRGRSRLEEFAAVLDEVVGIATAEAVDAVLLAGDLYEQRAPAPEADEIVFDTLLRLHDAGIPVVAIPGNHDSAVRLGAIGKLVRPLGVLIAARVAAAEDGGVIEVPSRDGSEAALVACLPFVAERYLGEAATLFAGPGEWQQSYAEGVGAIVAALAASFRPDRVNVLLAHLFVTGARFGGGEREVSISLDYAVPPSRLPGTATYVALGHIHKPQDVPGAPARARYPGSLLQLDFGEVDQEKSVTIVDASPGRPPDVRAVPLSGGRRLYDVRGTLDEIEAAAGTHGDAYLRVTVLTDGPVPGIGDRVRDLLPDALEVRLEYERAEPLEAAGRLASLRPRDQFTAYYETAHGAPPAEPVLEAFDEVLLAVGEEAG